MGYIHTHPDPSSPLIALVCPQPAGLPLPPQGREQVLLQPSDPPLLGQTRERALVGPRGAGSGCALVWDVPESQQPQTAPSTHGCPGS